MKIGVFDSGVGGLAILSEFVRVLPNYDYIYLGDNARMPYGDKSTKHIYQFTSEAVDFLFKKGCALVILACNTATAGALRKIQREFLPVHFPKRRVLGIIRPAVEYIAAKKIKRLGVIGTRSTIVSGSFERELKKLSPHTIVYQNACPLLADYIEGGEKNKKIITLLVREYLKPFIGKHIDALLLGCTHYSFIDKEVIKASLRGRVEIIDEGPQAAVKLKKYLVEHIAIRQKLTRAAGVQLFVTDLSDHYHQVVASFLENKIDARGITEVTL